MNPFATPIRATLVLAAALALTVVPGAAPAGEPLLELSPITVADGAAAISGTVGNKGAGTVLTVNGHQLGLDAAGAFDGVVALDGASAITLAIDELGSRQQTQYTIPLTGALLGPGGVIPGNVLDSLEAAGVSLLTPVRNASGSLVTASGGVLDRGRLASLTLNGVDILGALKPDGTFTVELPGTTSVVTVAATDTSGTTLKKTTPAFVPPSARTVSAARAVGLRITKVRFLRKGTARTHRIRMTVTVKDKRGRLVRGAKISVRSARAGRLVRQPRASRSGVRGRATFVLRLRKVAFGKRLVVVTVAKTPRAKATRRTAVFVPRRAPARR